MLFMWCSIGAAIFLSISLIVQWHNNSRLDATKAFILEMAQIEKRLALLNPFLARGDQLAAPDQAWLEKMLVDRRITSDPSKWVRPDLGYDAISGTFGEFIFAFIKSGCSQDLLQFRDEQQRQEKIQRMIAEFGMLQSEEQTSKWSEEHDTTGAEINAGPVSPGQRIFHVAVS